MKLSGILNVCIFALALLSLLLTLGCEENPSEPSLDPQLSVSKTSLDFGSESTESTFTITNQGEGTLEWSISSSQNWLSCSPNSGSTTTESDGITVTVNRSGLSDGSYEGEIRVTPNFGAVKSISVQMVVPPPELSVSVTELDFGSTEDEMSFTITNTGGGTLDWEISEDSIWMYVIPSSGETSTETDQISVSVIRTYLSAGDYESAISVTSNAGTKTISVQMSKGERIWQYNFSTNTDLDLKWDCFDDDASSGEDYWGVSYDADRGIVAWCNGRGDHDAGRYDNNMDAKMRLKVGEGVNVISFSDATIRFWMKYETETGPDHIRMTVCGNDYNWHYLPSTHWSGGNFTWHQYEVNLSDFGDVAPTILLWIGFSFTSDFSIGYRGAYIDDIEVWGIE